MTIFYFSFDEKYTVSASIEERPGSTHITTRDLNTAEMMMLIEVIQLSIDATLEYQDNLETIKKINQTHTINRGFN